MNSPTFILPKTPTCQVVYTREGVKYSAIIPTPCDTSALQMAMLKRQVGITAVQKVEPIQPLSAPSRGHPAAHRMAKYLTASDH